MNAIVVALLTASSVIVTAVLTYLGVVRKLSGRVSTTDAAQLWDEARGIREDYSARLKIAMDRIATLEVVTEQLRREVYALEETNAKLRAAVLGPDA